MQLICTCRNVLIIMIVSPAPHLMLALNSVLFCCAVSDALTEKLLYILEHSAVSITAIITTMTVILALSAVFFIQWLGLEGTSEPTQSHPVPWAGLPPTSSAAQGPIQPGLEHLQGWGTTASLGSCASTSPPSQ